MINNLPLELANEPSLDYLNGQPHRTRVTLTNADGAHYPVFFDVDAINKPLPDLLKMALEVVYEKNSPGRAEDEKFNLLGKKIGEADAAIDAAKEQYQKMEKMMKVMSATLNQLISTRGDDR
ncbi:DUF1366 domain-containing protein [Streptococcus dysgalactiae]|uniref:DUF1366 domain-containing protein n=1 Tax=Streptococcus dysgalactiae subsp. dysgalactiae TaxID=99822 RepID=A0A9X7S5E2_STRDY|nr:DUF1366 domain-containing protein [Streptococcus dysgalactiae]QGH01235.1 DUF1366 domain-containing protein [Streptococcus dysgalactiae subsp. dysgalactiae]